MAPGIDIMPMTLGAPIRRGMRWVHGGMSLPHLAYHWGQREAQGLLRNWPARFQPRRAEGEVHFDLITVLTVKALVSSTPWSSCGGDPRYAHELLEHIVDRDHDRRNGISRKHPNDGDWEPGKITVYFLKIPGAH